MSQVDEAQLKALVAEKFEEMVTANSCAVAALALLIYDYFLTLSDEIKCVWKGKFSGVTVLFLLNRYVTLLYRILMVVQLWPWYTVSSEAQADKTSYARCIGIMRASEGLTILVELTVAMFMALRLFAVWSSDRRIFLFVLFLGLVTPIINIYYYTTIQIVATPLPFSGCGEVVNLNTGAAPIVFNRIFAMAADAIILILTWIRTADIMRTFKLRVKSSLGVMLLRDGTLYFLFMFTLNVVNLIAIKEQKFGAVPALSDVITAILISRFLLNLRRVYIVSDESSKSFHASRFSDLRFANSVTGNMGAPLATMSEKDLEHGDDEEPEREEVFSKDPMLIGILHLDEEGGAGATDAVPILFERPGDAGSLRSQDSESVISMTFEAFERDGLEAQVKASDSVV